MGRSLPTCKWLHVFPPPRTNHKAFPFQMLFPCTACGSTISAERSCKWLQFFDSETQREAWLRTKLPLRRGFLSFSLPLDCVCECVCCFACFCLNTNVSTLLPPLSCLGPEVNIWLADQRLTSFVCCLMPGKERKDEDSSFVGNLLPKPRP